MVFIDIPSGERFQQLATVYLGYDDDFNFNPLIAKQTTKHLNINSIPLVWDNPPILFCYSYRVKEFAEKINALQNKCVIIFGNSDQNMSSELCMPYLTSEKIIHIFCQNIAFSHPKASFIPIGLANKQWDHGDPGFIRNIHTMPIEKTGHIFSSFNCWTNRNVRERCLDAVYRSGIENITSYSPNHYIQQLAKHRFSFCPEGNGLDCHRFWECLWVKTIPIVTRSPMTEQFQAAGIPCVLINSWDSFDSSQLPDYSSFTFDDTYYYSISFSRFRNDILTKVASANESMTIALSFIGNMPAYVVDCIRQARLFFNGPIYLIYSEMADAIKTVLDTMSVVYVHYDTVRSERFEHSLVRKQFHTINALGDRKHLFKRSYERIYLLEHLIELHDLKNVWFMELDIMMYLDPSIFLTTLQKYPYVYCHHTHDHCSSAILYVRDSNSLQPIIDTLDEHVGGFMSEMVALFKHHIQHPNDILLPLIHETPVDKRYWSEYISFYGYIFDGATIGQYLFGVDPFHTSNIIIRNDHSRLQDHVPIWEHGTFEWHRNSNGHNIPYYKRNDTSELIPIVNLHIHSKDLVSSSSLMPMA